MSVWVQPNLGFSASYEHGVWFMRLPLGVIMLKAPWNEPLFSERYGYKRRLPIAFGWRVLFFK